MLEIRAQISGFRVFVSVWPLVVEGLGNVIEETRNESDSLVGIAQFVGRRPLRHGFQILILQRQQQGGLRGEVEEQ